MIQLLANASMIAWFGAIAYYAAETYVWAVDTSAEKISAGFYAALDRAERLRVQLQDKQDTDE